MDIEFLTPPPQEPASIDMRLSIEPEMDNRGEEEKGKHASIEEEKEREQRIICLTQQHLV
jgi:hypothetical protein